MSDTHDKAPIARRFRGFLPIVIDVETGGFNPKRDALLEIAAVTLEITGPPGASLIINGQDMGFFPLDSPLDLDPGIYRIKSKLPGHIAYEHELTDSIQKENRVDEQPAFRGPGPALSGPKHAGIHLQHR